MTRTAALFATLLCCSATAALNAQALPTATQSNAISVFAGGSYVATRLYEAKNVAITAGANYSFPEFFHVHPAVEVRGSYPVRSGTGVSEKNVLGGIRLMRHYGRVNPYVDGLFGRGSLNYPTGGYFNAAGTVDYSYTSSNVFAGGGGVDLNLNSTFGIKFDGQYERYVTPITSSGKLGSLAATAALVYRFDFDHHPREETTVRRTKVSARQPLPAPAPLTTTPPTATP